MSCTTRSHGSEKARRRFHNANWRVNGLLNEQVRQWNFRGSFHSGGHLAGQAAHQGRIWSFLISFPLFVSVNERPEICTRNAGEDTSFSNLSSWPCRRKRGRTLVSDTVLGLCHSNSDEGDIFSNCSTGAHFQCTGVSPRLDSTRALADAIGSFHV